MFILVMFVTSSQSSISVLFYVTEIMRDDCALCIIFVAFILLSYQQIIGIKHKHF